MFIPKHYAEDDIEIQKELIKKVGLGVVVTTSEDGEFNANHYPFVVTEKADGKLYLQAHFHIKNEQGKDLNAYAEASKNVLVVFQGPNDYVSPSWYATKAETHKVAPTWLYATVHAYGKPRVIKDADELQAILEKLTNQFESLRKVPWSVSEAPEAYINLLKKSIYGLEIEVTKMVGKFKMNQPSPAKDVKGTIAGFKERDDPASQAFGALVEESNERYAKAKADAKS